MKLNSGLLVDETKTKTEVKIKIKQHLIESMDDSGSGNVDVDVDHAEFQFFSCRTRSPSTESVLVCRSTVSCSSQVWNRMDSGGGMVLVV